jgi:hypothetical protein
LRTGAAQNLPEKEEMTKSTRGPITTGQHKSSCRAEGGALTRGYGVIAGTADDQVKVPTGAAQRPEGVVEEAVDAAGKVVSIIRHGEAIAIAGGASQPLRPREDGW